VSMQTVTVPALVDFKHDGRSYRKGEAVTVAPIVASVLAQREYVSLLSKVIVPVRERVKRRYRRRDLSAES